MVEEWYNERRSVLKGFERERDYLKRSMH